MTRTHIEYVARLHEGIGWARARVSELLHGVAVGLVADLIAEGAREAVRARIPAFAAPDALRVIGRESRLRRYTQQSQAQYRAWVEQRWSLHREHGTPQAVRRAVLYGAHTDGRVVEDGWARFWLRLVHGRAPLDVFAAPAIGAHNVGGSALIGVSGVDPVSGATLSTQEQLAAWARDVNDAANDWRPMRSRYLFGAYPTTPDTVLVGDGHTIGDGSILAAGGTVAYI